MLILFSRGIVKKIVLGDKNITSRKKCLFMVKANSRIMVYLPEIC